MIPYDELVAALQAWRARQGLPVSITQSPSAPGAQLASNGATARTGTPPLGTPQRSTTAPRMPLPLAPVDLDEENLDHIEEAALIDDGHYETEGDDFAMEFGNGRNGHHTSEETVVGGNEDVPEPTDPARTHNTREDW